MRHPILLAALIASAAPALTGCKNTADEPAPDTAAQSRAEAKPSAEPAAQSSARPATTPARAPSTQSTPFTGTLRGDVAAIGGETTGWRLEGDAQTGGIDVDVSEVQARAKQLDGQRVTVTGKMTTRSWPERGETQVLVVEKVEAAPVKEK